jgi:hypothetical protein
MIKIDIDLRNATQGEIDALHGIAGFQSALSELQANGRRYNAVVNVLQAGNELDEVKALLMRFMREHNMKSGHVIPQKPFMFTFMPSLNPRQNNLLQSAADALVNDGILTDDRGTLRLTDAGYQALY